MEARPLMVLAVGFLALGFATGCASEGPASSEFVQQGLPVAVAPATDAASTGASKESYDACAVDDDCIKVPRVGCCNNGWKEAVNRHQREAYARSFTCETERPICLMYLVQDMGVPRCKQDTHTCELVNPDGSPRPTR